MAQLVQGVSARSLTRMVKPLAKNADVPTGRMPCIRLDKHSGGNLGFTGTKQQPSQFGQHTNHDLYVCRPLGTRALGPILKNPSLRSISPHLTTPEHAAGAHLS